MIPATVWFFMYISLLGPTNDQRLEFNLSPAYATRQQCVEDRMRVTYRKFVVHLSPCLEVPASVVYQGSP